MRYIGPNKFISYINSNNTDEDKHMWLPANQYNEAVKIMLKNEKRPPTYVGELEKLNKRRYLSVIDGGKIKRDNQKDN
tara:strand:- start:139 stop:372 length:234 start_codon:yes stop_codon:yes gene_type:complete